MSAASNVFGGVYEEVCHAIDTLYLPEATYLYKYGVALDDCITDEQKINLRWNRDQLLHTPGCDVPDSLLAMHEDALALDLRAFYQKWSHYCKFDPATGGTLTKSS